MAEQTVAVTRDGSSLRGVASDGVQTYAAFVNAGAVAGSAAGTPSFVEARRGTNIIWRTSLPGTAGEVAVTGTQVAVALTGTGTFAISPTNASPTNADATNANATNANATNASPAPMQPIELRGDPASVLAVLDPTTGAVRWRLAFDSTEWALITSIASAGDDFLVAGTFGGTLRVGSRVVSTAGGSDGFVARVAANGHLSWLVRLGGPGADGIQGVATSIPPTPPSARPKEAEPVMASPATLAAAKHGEQQHQRIAIAGTFSVGADILGHPLAAQDERSPFGDAFVAELDGLGAWRWQSSFGSRADDAVAGVAIDRSGRVVVAASVREVVKVGSATFVTSGAGDGIAVWFGDDGEIGATTVLGGGGFDGIRDIAAVGDHVILGGFFSGWLKLGDRDYEAAGGDDSFLAALDPSGTVMRAWHVGGAGREEITAVSPVPGGFIAGVAHTAAAQIDDARVPAPGDPSSGAALVVRGY